jgi:hypothetical protein
MTPTQFPIRIGSRSAPLLRILFGVTASRAFATIDDRRVAVRFGRFEIEVAVANIERWRIEGPWRWITAIGVRRSIRGGDISFAGSPRGGVRLDLRQRMRFGPFRVPAVYVGAEDLDGFAAALAALGVPGEDARRG